MIQPTLEELQDKILSLESQIESLQKLNNSLSKELISVTSQKNNLLIELQEKIDEIQQLEERFRIKPKRTGTSNNVTTTNNRL